MRTRHGWFVFRVKNGLDDQAGESLERVGLETFQPSYVKKVIHHRHKVWMTRSFRLLPGYIFVRAHGALDWELIRRCCIGVIGVLGDSCQPHVVPDFEVETLRREIELGFYDDDVQGPTHGFQPNAMVTVAEGPFAGFKGQVASLKGKRLALVKLTAEWLRSTSTIELPVSMLEAA